MISVDDVAAYILQKQGPMSSMKLQKLLYYSQAWSLVWDERPLFGEPVEAWIGGPVIRSIYDSHKGQFIVSAWSEGDSSKLDESARETVDAVLDTYGAMTAQQLSDLTHGETPWITAREGTQPNERGNIRITDAMMHEYYSGLPKDVTLAKQA